MQITIINDASGPCHCDNCEWRGDAEKLDSIIDIGDRISAGCKVPAGQCPACGALAYQDKGVNPLHDAAPDLLAALEALFEHCAMIHKHWGEGCNQKEANVAQQQGRAAIAKARGQ